MATGGDIIRITDRQLLLGQQVLNVYFYQLQEEGIFLEGYLELIASHFVEAVVTPVLVAQHELITHTELFLENLTNGVDILTYSDGFPMTGGEDSGDVMPPYVSLGFQLIRESRVTRNGYKRIGGIPENAVTNGVADYGAGVLDDIQNGMKADLVEGLATLCHPVIVRHPIEIPLTDPILSNIGDCLFKQVGTQNTRKFGRGV